MNTRTDWFCEAGWGVMVHYLTSADRDAESWNARVDAFDVDGLAAQLEPTGAKYFLLTVGQNSGHYCAPNDTYDQIVDIRPSKCSKRDLVIDLAQALEPRGIRLLAYLPSGAPAADSIAVERLKWRWGYQGEWPNVHGGPTRGERLVEFQQNWEAIIREWSLRWSSHVHGWWIDGCYFADDMYRFEDAPNFGSFAQAMRVGNPESIVAFNPGVKVPIICHSEDEDYTAGEISEALPTCHGRWIERSGHNAQLQVLTYMGSRWGSGDGPRFPDEMAVGYTQYVRDKGGVITWEVPVQTNGLIPQAFVDQLCAIGHS